jgi:hypothetical protein
MLATVNANAIVANGALNAFPTKVRRSNEVPKLDNHRIAVKTYDGFEWNDRNVVAVVVTIALMILAL